MLVGKQERDKSFGPFFSIRQKTYKRYSLETLTCIEDNYQNGLIIWGTLGTWLKANAKVLV